ncbi:helix-turn-helix domain-containing protein [Robertkochia marina]|uniref:Helix-turn-helix domain-containing protein n=1 Tax=Robertkochia marina TaxID=1227945 RepID=A0A4S3M2Y8_9FLAO|nr:helix-turn-helix domain-containing protein [Robertkochia marina]THD67855.1 helix-turn-helix domain-containing protein [Robertkochia marina]TRZ42106.1 helix-turn-helix domain-containing protein [Robertkochia marina]
MTSNASDKAAHPLIARLEAIVLEHLDAPDFDVETFADLSGLSRSELYRKIKKHTGKSVTEFVRDIRLHKALEYLRDEERTASEVAYLVGFSSATYFNKCFKDKFGFTPGEAGNHQEKIGEILNYSPGPNSETKLKSSKFKTITITISAIIVIIFGWYFLSNQSNTNSPNSGADKTELPENHSKENSIAVIPLTILLDDPEFNFLALGIVDEIIRTINADNSTQKALHASIVSPFKDSLLTPDKIAEILKVKYVLQGSIQKAGRQFKISLTYTDVEDNTQVWSENLIKQYDSIQPFRMQDEIAEFVMKKIGVDEPFYEDVRDARTASAKAHKYFYQGVEQLNKSTLDAWKNAIDLFNKAIKEDSLFVNAYLNLALTWQYGGLNWSYTSQEEAWANSKLFFSKALEIDPENTYALRNLKDGFFYYELKIGDSIPGIERISHEDHITFNTDYATKTGHYTEAHVGHEYYMKRNPEYGQVYVLMAINKFLSGEPDLALEILDENYHLYKDDFDFLREAAKGFYFLEEYDKMENAILHFFEKFSERPPILRWLRAIVADKNNNQAMVEEQLQHLMDSYQNRESGSPAWFIALYHAYNKDEDKTLEWLEKSYEAREVEMTWLAQEPDLHIVGDQPRYRALLDSMNFPESARRHVIFKD